MTPSLRTRRGLAALAFLTASVLVAGCGKAHEDSTGPAVLSGVPAAAPAATKDVDQLTWNLPGGEPTTLDPVKIYGGSDLMVEANLCESLMTLTPEGTVVPGLAEALEHPDPLTYTVKLRSGVTFTDGSPVSAEDVVFSLDRIRAAESGSYWAFFAQNVASITASGPNAVTIRLSQPDAIFGRMLATPMAQVVSKTYVDAKGADYGTPTGGVMCTGPYKLGQWQQGNAITLEANPSWWANRPQRAKTVKFTFLTDDSTVTSALLNGDISGSFDIPHATLSRLKAAPDGQVFAGPSTRQLVVIPTGIGGTGPLSNPKLRQALAKSIDYAGILGSTLANVAQPLRAPAPPGAWGTARAKYQAAYDQLTDPAQDLAKAKALVQESGVPNPAITLAVPSEIPEYVTIGETLQSNARQAGFTVTLKPLPSADFSALYADKDARSKVDAFLMDYYADIPDPVELYMQFGIPGGSADFGGYNNPEVASVLQKARQTENDDERAALTVQAQKILVDDLVWIPLAYPLQTLYLNNKFGGANAAFPSVMYSAWLPAIGGR